MEHRPLDISAINFGNFMLGKWLQDEEKFWKGLIASLPQQICMVSAYDSLVRVGELPKWSWKGMKGENIDKAKETALQWCPDAESNKLNRLIQAVLVLNNLAEKKLSVTTGV